jgi:hypothetical protein
MLFYYFDKDFIKTMHDSIAILNTIYLIRKHFLLNIIEERRGNKISRLDKTNNFNLKLLSQQLF